MFGTILFIFDETIGLLLLLPTAAAAAATCAKPRLLAVEFDVYKFCGNIEFGMLILRPAPGACC